MTVDDDEAPFELANLSPMRTGLPFVVWIASQSGGHHETYVKVSRNAKARPTAMTTVAIQPNVCLIDGAMSFQDLSLLKAWIELNRETLTSYWEGDIDTADAIKAVVKAGN